MYKGKYLITLYAKNDNLLLVTETVRELSDYLKKELKKLKPIVSRCYNTIDKHTRIWLDTEFVDLYLIDTEE